MRNAVLERLSDERDRLHEQIDDVLAAVQEDERDPSDAERELLTRHRSRLETIEPQIVELVELEERRGNARDARGVLERARAANPEAPPQPPPSTSPVLYRNFAEWARDELIVRFDAIARRSGAPREVAQERLTRAVANTLSSDVPGLLPPQHIAQIIDVINARRPIVESSRQIALQNGKLTYPKISQRPTVSKQAAEKTETPSQKMVVDMMDVLADTYLGAGDLSWQTINWGVPDALALWFQLAAEAYAQQTEAAAGATLIAAATPNTTTGTGPTFPEVYAALVEAAGNVYARVRQPADVIYADVATGFRLAGAVSDQAPVFNTPGNLSTATGQGTVGAFRLVTSAGLPSPTVIVGVAQMLLCAETAGAPVELRAVEPSIGGMEVGVIGAFASEAMEPEAFELVTLPPPAPLAARSSGSTTTAGK